MKKIYVDAAYSDEYRIGCYCVVVVDDDTGEKKWEINRFEGGISPMEAETAGIRHALGLIDHLRPDRNERAEVFCDSVGAIKECNNEARALNVRLRWVKAHRLNKPGELVTEDRKRQHWCDVMAYQYLQNIVDILSTSENNTVMQETTQ